MTEQQMTPHQALSFLGSAIRCGEVFREPHKEATDIIRAALSHAERREFKTEQDLISFLDGLYETAEPDGSALTGQKWVAAQRAIEGIRSHAEEEACQTCGGSGLLGERPTHQNPDDTHCEPCPDCADPATQAAAQKISVLRGELVRERDYRLRAEAQVDYLKHRLGDEHASVWYWQGDGYDHLNSLVSSVTVAIRADDLRHLLGAPQVAVPEVSETALRRAALFLDGLGSGGKEVRTLRKLLAATAPAAPAGQDHAAELCAAAEMMAGWFESAAKDAGWTRENANAAWAAHTVSRAAIRRYQEGFVVPTAPTGEPRTPAIREDGARLLGFGSANPDEDGDGIVGVKGYPYTVPIYGDTPQPVTDPDSASLRGLLQEAVGKLAAVAHRPLFDAEAERIVERCRVALSTPAPDEREASQVAPAKEPLHEIADALDCFWNAATGAAHGNETVGAIAQGLSAVAERLREHELSRLRAVKEGEQS